MTEYEKGIVDSSLGFKPQSNSDVYMEGYNYGEFLIQKEEEEKYWNKRGKELEEEYHKQLELEYKGKPSIEDLYSD